MMKFKRIFSVISIILILASLFSGCGKATKIQFNDNPEVQSLPSQTIAETDELKFDFINEVDNKNSSANDQKMAIGVVITDKKTGKVWSTLERDDDGSYLCTATLNLSVQDTESYQIGKVSNGEFNEPARDENDEVIYDEYYMPVYESVLKVDSKKIDNGVELTYYFLKYKISVPLTYRLVDNSLKISIDSSKIAEGSSQYKLRSATVVPTLARVSDKSKNAYLLVSTSGGAGIMNAQDTVEGSRDMTAGASNYISLSTESSLNGPKTARFPIFGAKEGKNAIFCIAEETSGALGYSASAGSTSSSYASIVPEFYFTDSDYTAARKESQGSIYQLSERTQDTITLGCYFLNGKDANYMGMAECYRNYLNKNGYIEKSEVSQSPYAVDVLGGVMTTSSILGIPKKTLKTLTTVDKAQSIIEELTNLTSYKPVVCLTGFGESGINVGKIAGGFKVASKLGNKTDIKSIQQYAKDNGVSLYTDFEMAKFSESGNGFSYKADSAKTAILHYADKTGTNVVLRDSDESNQYRILSRARQGDVVDKVIKTTDKLGISGINLSTLGSVVYSDYTDAEKYAISANSDKDFKEYMTKLRNSGKSVSGKASTFFAAGLVDTVFDVDLSDYRRYMVDYSIPFYQMVFSDVTPLYSTAINTSDNPNKTIASAAATGTGISFKIVDKFELSYMETNADKLYACEYAAIKDSVKESVNKFATVYNATSGSKIVDYKISDNNVSVTTFENGAVVYANHSNKTVKTKVGKLGGYEFKLGGK